MCHAPKNFKPQFLKICKIDFLQISCIVTGCRYLAFKEVSLNSMGPILVTDPGSEFSVGGPWPPKDSGWVQLCPRLVAREEPFEMRYYNAC